MEEIFARVSVRDYAPDMVEDDELHRMLDAAMHAPSAVNQQPWEFIVVDDPGLLRRLSGVTPYAGPVGRAPAAVVVLGNRDLMVAPQMWEQDLAACTENMLLAAAGLGLGAVWIGVAPVRERMDAVAEIFGLPGNVLPFCIVAVGHPREAPRPHGDRFRPERVHRNGYRAGTRRDSYKNDPPIRSSRC